MGVSRPIAPSADRLGAVKLIEDVPVRAAVAAAQPAYTENSVELASAIGKNLPLVRADADRLAEVLANLLDNALRHTPANGRVTVSAEQHDTDVVLTVRDTGDGIARDQLEQIFERFFRTDAARSRDRGGSGLGLTISRAIVEAHGGELTADSDGAGHGSRFSVRLPAA